MSTWNDCHPAEVQAAREKFDALTVAEKVEIHNRYCNVFSDPDDIIDSMDSFLQDYLCCMKPGEAFRLGIMAGPFCYNDEWVTFDGNGNVISNNNPEAAGWIHTADIITTLAKSGDYLKDPAEWFDGIRADEY